MQGIAVDKGHSQLIHVGNSSLQLEMHPCLHVKNNNPDLAAQAAAQEEDDDDFDEEEDDAATKKEVFKVSSITKLVCSMKDTFNEKVKD